MSSADKYPAISIVMPVRNAQDYLDRSLSSVYANSFKDFEMIVVNDGSKDDSEKIIRKYPIDTYIVFPSNKGHAVARNEGANKAKGRIILFIDADIELKEDTLKKIFGHFEDTACQCVIGLYSKTHPNSDIFSCYKNMWIHYTYFTSPERVNWFFSAIGAIKKEIWDKSGFFDPKFHIKTGGGDIDFGFRLIRQGISIILDKDIEVIHLKKFNLYKLLKNDFMRSFGYIRLALIYNRSLGDIAKQGIANAQNSFAVSTIASAIIAVLFIMSVFSIWMGFMGVLFVLMYLKLNYPFYKYSAEELSIRKTIFFIPIMYVDHFVCAIGVICSILCKYLSDLKTLADE